MKQSKIRKHVQRGHILIQFKENHKLLDEFMLLQQNDGNKPIEIELMYSVVFGSYME